MMKANSLKNIMRSNRGESLIFVVIFMLVFFVLGLAVLGAAASGYGVERRRQDNYKSYYYARSLMDVLDDSMINGDLGQAFAGLVEEQLNNSSEGNYPTSVPEVSYSPTVDLEVYYPNEQMLKDLVINSIEVKFSVDSIAVNTEEGKIKTAAVSGMHVSISVDAGSESGSYRLGAEYICSGTLENTGGTIAWTEQIWALNTLE